MTLHVCALPWRRAAGDGAQVIAKQAFPMFLNVTANVTNWNAEGTECSLVGASCCSAAAGGFVGRGHHTPLGGGYVLSRHMLPNGPSFVGVGAFGAVTARAVGPPRPVHSTACA